MDARSFVDQAVVFLNKLNEELNQKKLSLPLHWDIDHICFRTESEDEYMARKTQFSSFAQLLIESPVNGRLISTYKLEAPIEFLGRRIDLVELPAPKKNKATPSGFEHIEITVDESFEEVKSRLVKCNSICLEPARPLIQN
jgi:predicted metalloenzyme YecM